MRASVLIALTVLAACGDETPCADLEYAVDVQPLIARSCLGCHSIDVQGANRQGAPRNANYDTEEDLARAGVLDAMLARVVAGKAPMPPVSSSAPRISTSEVAVIKRWQACGRRP